MRSYPFRLFTGAIGLSLCLGCNQGEHSPESLPPAHAPRQLETTQRIVSPEVRSYLEERQRKLSIVATTRLRSGDTIDWIDVRSQVPGGEIASPPPDLPDRSIVDGEVRGELEAQPEAQGPAGTVPVLRTDPNRIHAVGSVQDFLSKYGDASSRPLESLTDDPPQPQDGSPANHFYATSRQTVTNFGADGFINLWQPFVLFPQEMSIAQMAISRASFPIQTVETGWHVLGSLYGDYSTRFFVFYTTNGYASTGGGLGGYNAVQPGWVQVSTTMFPGTILSPVSVLGGAQYDFYVRVQLFSGNWWVQFQNEWVGYYPASLFAPTGLQSQGARASFYGETYDDPLIAGMTSTDMGSGLFPTLGTWWTNAAFMHNLRFQSDVAGTMTKYAPSLISNTNPNCYKIVGNFSATDAWQSQFYFGGPGQGVGCP